MASGTQTDEASPNQPGPSRGGNIPFSPAPLFIYLLVFTAYSPETSHTRVGVNAIHRAVATTRKAMHVQPSPSLGSPSASLSAAPRGLFQGTEYP